MKLLLERAIHKMDKKQLHLQIGVNIANIRKRFGYTQEQLAERLGISKSFLAHVEQGDAQFSMDNLWSFASTLQVSADEILFGISKETRAQEILLLLNRENMASLDTICGILHLIADGGTSEFPAK